MISELWSWNYGRESGDARHHPIYLNASWLRAIINNKQVLDVLGSPVA